MTSLPMHQKHTAMLFYSGRTAMWSKLIIRTEFQVCALLQTRRETPVEATKWFICPGSTFLTHIFWMSLSCAKIQGFCCTRHICEGQVMSDQREIWVFAPRWKLFPHRSITILANLVIFTIALFSKKKALTIWANMVKRFHKEGLYPSFKWGLDGCLNTTHLKLALYSSIFALLSV